MRLPIDKSKLKKELNKQKLGSFHKTVGGGEGSRCFYPTRLDTYGKGCYFNCQYCYAKNLLDFRKLWKPNSPAATSMKEMLQTIKKIPKGSVVRLGGMTDCFQPIEKIKRNTYKTIQLLNRKKIHYLIVTKSDLIINEEYLNLMSRKLAHIQVSIPTNDNKTLAATDNAKPFEVRKNVVETLQEQGFDTSLRLAPFLYSTADYDVINAIKVDKVLVEFLRLKSVAKSNPLNKVISLNPYTYKEGGYYHLPFNTKMKVLRKLDFKELSICEDVEAHYNYFLKNVCYNPNDCCNLRI
jgi:DNA repair photolyase